jgi:aspartate-semialdehyde dehydrogenase
MATKLYHVAVVGATGLVGQEIIKILEQRNFPVGSLQLFTTDSLNKQKLFVKHQEMAVQEVTTESFRGIDIAFFSAGRETVRYLLPFAVKAGTLVIDNSPAFRMDKDVQLVVPEVNLEDIKIHHGIIASPGSLTVPLTTITTPLHRLNPVKRIIVDTYQSVSANGAAAVEELTKQTRQVLDGQAAVSKVYPHQIAFNLLPETDVFLDTGYTREERGIMDETRKIMHTSEIAISATCVRVPVFLSHSASIHIEFTKSITPEDVRQVLSGASGVRVLDDTTVSLYPQPWAVVGSDDCYVGRIRQDVSHKNGVAMWIVADNIRKGAALNMVQIAEETIKRGWLSAGG